jgi:electron transfer flavoprotein alpha/beta subunit
VPATSAYSMSLSRHTDEQNKTIKAAFPFHISVSPSINNHNTGDRKNCRANLAKGKKYIWEMAKKATKSTANTGKRF